MGLPKQKVARVETAHGAPDGETEAKIVEQAAELTRVRQALQKICTTDELQLLCIENDSDIVDGAYNLVNRCADFLTFGALSKCPKCHDGDLKFVKIGYKCSCGNFDIQPKRVKCVIPDDLKPKKFFKTYEQKVQHRLIGKPAMPSALSASSPSASRTPSPDLHEIVNKYKATVLRNDISVDSNSGKSNVAHVYHRENAFFTSVLGFTDTQTNTISYIKLQVLQSDFVVEGVHQFWIFTSRGTIGNDMCDAKTEEHSFLDLALLQFEQIYYDHTGNEWQLRSSFRRLPGMW